jgi:hypothetical protein
MAHLFPAIVWALTTFILAPAAHASDYYVCRGDRFAGVKALGASVF